VRNRSNLWTTCLVAPLLGLVVSMILRNRAVQSEPYTLANNNSFIAFFFLAVVIAIFLALSNSIAEIVKDRSILMRERMLDIPRSAYLLAKYAILCFFGIVQVALFLGVSFVVLEVRELFVLHWALLSLTVMAATAMGLFISSWPNLSEKAASNLLPLILIPQIILAGSDVFKFDDMKHLVVANWWSSAASAAAGSQPNARKLRRKVPEIAEFILARWAYEGLVVLHATFSKSQAINAAQQDLEYFLAHYKEIEAREGKEAYGQHRKQKEATLEQLKRDLAPYRIDRLDSKVRNFGQDTFLISHKQLWFSERLISTVYFNAAVIVLFAVVFLLLAYAGISSGGKLAAAWRNSALALTSWRQRWR
jgi:ABC-2 type transporter